MHPREGTEQVDVAVAADVHLGVADHVEHLDGMGVGIARQGTVVAGGDTAITAGLHGLRGDVLERARHGAGDVVAEEVNRHPVAVGQLEAEVSVIEAHLLGPLDVRETAHDVGPHLHGLLHEPCGLGIGVESLLWERAHLKLHQVAEPALCLERALELDESGEAVHVDEHPTGDNSVGKAEAEGLADAVGNRRACRPPSTPIA